MQTDSNENIRAVEQAIAESKKLVDDNANLWSEPLVKFLESKQAGLSHAWFCHLHENAPAVDVNPRDEKAVAYLDVISDIMCAMLPLLPLEEIEKEERRLTRTDGDIRLPDPLPGAMEQYKSVLDEYRNRKTFDSKLHPSLKEIMPEQYVEMENARKLREQFTAEARESVVLSFRYWAQPKEHMKWN
jgi:hypothetical protein